MPVKSYTLSKSRYTRGLKCHKSLWLYTHKRKLRDKEDPGTTARFSEGDQVGKLAQQLFPGGVMILQDKLNFEEQIRQTAEAMKTAKVIYEATFCHDGVLVMADIIRKGRSGWELYEVKSSGSLKDIYRHDIAIQYYVISGSGVNISKTCLVHLNCDYVRKGAIDVKELFTTVNITADVKEKQAEVKKEIARQKRMLADNDKEPKIDIGPHCSDPYDCDFEGHCWKNIPDNSVFDLAGNGVKKFDLYRKEIIHLKDIPLEMVKGQQKSQLEAFLGKKAIVKKPELKEFLDSLWYPLCFLDFETFMCAIPPYDGLTPFHQVPFQYSLHMLKRAGGKLYHREFLAQPNVDPRKAFIDSLLDEIPEDACILAYNRSFELGRLKELAKQFPRKKKRIQQIIDSTLDLMAPFQKRHIYSWKQQGSHSIKAVLPAFVKGMSYERMEIGDGGAAMEAYHEMCAIADDSKALGKKRKDLLEYCCQDTLAMVKLLEVIQGKTV